MTISDYNDGTGLDTNHVRPLGTPPRSMALSDRKKEPLAEVAPDNGASPPFLMALFGLGMISAFALVW